MSLLHVLNVVFDRGHDILSLLHLFSSDDGMIPCKSSGTVVATLSALQWTERLTVLLYIALSVTKDLVHTWEGDMEALVNGEAITQALRASD